MKKRLDQYLVELGLSETRSKATSLIKDGKVLLAGEIVKKGSIKISEEEAQQVTVSSHDVFVGRGAKKLLGAIENFQLNVEGLVCTDIGASTGGFTEVLLNHGAARVYAIDVGRDQLAKKLREDERVINFEGVNIRHGIELDEKTDFLVADLSYISLRLVLKEMLSLLKENGRGVILVKPQFEVGKSFVGKGGIVKDMDKVRETLNEIYDLFEEHGAFLKDLMKSTITGKTGNQEYLFYFDLGLKESLKSKNHLESL